MAAAGEGGKEKGPGGACELCGAAARVYCGADEATLCWGCDAQVHGANFLVARHARALLCRGCARPTPWRAAGPRLGPTASLCDRCVRRGPGAAGAGGGGEEDDDGEGEDEDGEEEEGEGENQVVPWTEEADATPPPVASSTSSSSREAAANGANAAECAKEDVPCSTSQPGLCHYSSPTRHGGQSDEATSSRNGGRFLASRHRKRSPSDFLGSGSAQSVSGTPSRNCSNAGIGRNGLDLDNNVPMVELTNEIDERNLAPGTRVESRGGGAQDHSWNKLDKKGNIEVRMEILPPPLPEQLAGRPTTCEEGGDKAFSRGSRTRVRRGGVQAARCHIGGAIDHGGDVV
ncbi:hypothetical protein C2845_PM13G05880 [Panicum miliaceum]|uniref:B box-type domain-containing protein n=1 Tax=Panicum miliaceum TaxID=4540 RepID=A0A3L6RJL1_PANMI|nr:hypothetical protein C2845_PM13G05880 [Panicum miliaceum]